MAGDMNPAQLDVVEQLGASRAEWPVFDAGVRHELRCRLEERLAPVVEQLAPDQDLWLNKHTLALVHGCEARFLAEEQEEFQWSIPTARGTVTHKAIELSIHWRRERLPLSLVDEALARLEEGSDGLATWLQGRSEAERAELRGEVNDRVAKFLECWPPLKKEWRPVPESKMRAELVGGRAVLAGKVDLSLGQPEGLRAGKVLVDLKTGGTNPVHLEDLRFYALVETLRLGTPPRRLATYYLDQGRFLPEDVTVGLLESTVERVVAGAEKVVALRAGERDPVHKPSGACRWCPARHRCEPGQTHLAGDDDLLDDGWDL